MKKLVIAILMLSVGSCTALNDIINEMMSDTGYNQYSNNSKSYSKIVLNVEDIKNNFNDLYRHQEIYFDDDIVNIKMTDISIFNDLISFELEIISQTTYDKFFIRGESDIIFNNNSILTKNASISYVSGYTGSSDIHNILKYKLQNMVLARLNNTMNKVKTIYIKNNKLIAEFIY